MLDEDIVTQVLDYGMQRVRPDVDVRDVVGEKNEDLAADIEVAHDQVVGVGLTKFRMPQTISACSARDEVRRFGTTIRMSCTSTMDSRASGRTIGSRNWRDLEALPRSSASLVRGSKKVLRSSPSATQGSGAVAGVACVLHYAADAGCPRSRVALI